MPLPTRANVETLDYTLGAQPAALLEAKALSPTSYTLDYTLAAQPAVGLAGVTPPPPSGNTGAFFSIL
jgi:hypothetical protein